MSNFFYGVILFLLLLLAMSDVLAKESYIWLYGGYSYTPKEYSDPYLMEYGNDWGVITVGHTTCEKVSATTSLCAKIYYQHTSHHYLQSDKGLNSLNSGLELRWY